VGRSALAGAVRVSWWDCALGLGWTSSALAGGCGFGLCAVDVAGDSAADGGDASEGEVVAWVADDDAIA